MTTTGRLNTPEMDFLTVPQAARLKFSGTALPPGLRGKRFLTYPGFSHHSTLDSVVSSPSYKDTCHWAYLDNPE